MILIAWPGRRRMRKLMLLCEFATLNGGEQSMLSTLEGVAAAGFCPMVAAPPTGPLADTLRQHGIDLIPWTLHDERGRRCEQRVLRERLANLLSRHGPELLHANSLAMGRLAGPVVAEQRLPSIAHLRDIIRLRRAAIDDLNRHCRILAVSYATREYHVAAGLDPARVFVQYNGVDLKRFRPQHASGYLHRELRLPDEALLVGCIGQIGLRKGMDVLARAAVVLADQMPDVHYLIVGERHSDKEESRRFENDLHRVAVGPLAGRMHFLGWRDDVAQLLNELTLLVHPARQEPLGRVLLEGAAAGVAMIATDVGGTREIFPPNTAGAVLFGPDDPQLLAEKIRSLLSNPTHRAALGKAARVRAETTFDVNRATEDLVRHYQAVLDTIDVCIENDCFRKPNTY